MALSNYAELIASLASWLDGSSIAGQEETCVALATAEINARLATAIGEGAQIRPMLEQDDFVIDAEYVSLPGGEAGNSASIVLPLTLELIELTQPWTVDYIDPQSLARMNYGVASERGRIDIMTAGNPPRYYSIVGDRFRFFPAPLPGNTFAASFARFICVETLSADNPTNWVLTNHPNAYLYGALMQAEMFGWNDKRVAGLSGLFDQAVAGIIARYPMPTNNAPLRSDLAEFRLGALTYAQWAGGI